MDNDFATGYALGSDSGNCNNSGFLNGDGWWAIILFAMIFGWGNGGYGGFGGGINSPFGQGALTRADLCSEFNFNDLHNAVRGVQQGICDSTYALNNTITGGFNNTNVAMLQGFNGVDKAMCQLGYNLQDCCCQTQNAIQGVRYDMATQACDTRNTIQNATRDIIDNANANYRGLMDFMVQSKIDALQAENTNLKLQASQANQNAVLQAAMDANTAEIIRRTGHDCPVAAYVVPNPNCCYGNPAGVGYNNGYSGCGC